MITRLSDCLISDLKVQDKLISDHCLVFCRLHLPVRKAEKILLTSRNVKGIDRAVFRTDLVSAFSDVTDSDDPAQLVDNYNAVMTDLLDFSISTRHGCLAMCLVVLVLRGTMLR